MAAWASWSLPISTKPKPLDRPVSRSMMTWADCTVPCGANSCSSAASVTSNVRFPTYNFLPICELLKGPPPDSAEEGQVTERTRTIPPAARCGGNCQMAVDPTSLAGGHLFRGRSGHLFLDDL